MPQSFHFAGLFGALESIWRPSLLVPKLTYRNVSEIPFESLYQQGYRYLLFDKDNTLTAPYALDSPHQATIEKIKSIFGPKVYILSNHAGTNDDRPPEYPQARRIEEALGIPVIRYTSKKPNGGDQVVQFLKTRHSTFDKEGGNSSVAVVGDRLYTDVMFANKNGFLSIYVSEIISEKGDNPMALRVRLIV